MRPSRYLAGMRSALLLIAAAAVTGCGKVAELKPAPGQSLPVRPALASATPTAEELLTPPTYARPQRIDELMRRSEPRKADRFDLPPPDGGLAPALPETQQPTSSEEKGPVNPDE